MILSELTSVFIAVCRVSTTVSCKEDGWLFRAWLNSVTPRLFIIFGEFVSGPRHLSRYSDSLRAGRAEDRIVIGKRCFTSVQTGPEPTQHPVIGCWVSFLGIEWPGRGFDHPPHLTLRLKKEYSYTSAPYVRLHELLQGKDFLYLCGVAKCCLDF